MKEVEVIVNGRVQGVGFRDSIKKLADNLSLKGFIMNKKDGSVFLIVQGKDKNLDEIISFIHKGPGFSKVHGFSYKKRKMQKEYPDFRIVREKSFLLDQASSFFNLGRYFMGSFGKIPEHIAIIPDGNRRWAKGKGFDGTFGHYKSGAYDNLEELFREGKKLGVKYMSIWGFSTENWKRSKTEQKEIFDLVLSGVEKFTKDANKNKMRFRHIGRKDRLPKELIEALEKLEKETQEYKDFNVQLCLDYGGRDEILRAINKALESGKKNIDEKEFVKLLDTGLQGDMPDPDLIIRTSGEYRTSGFMPFQSAYSELYFSEAYFPDFDIKELREAIKEFGIRQRRFGGN